MRPTTGSSPRLRWALLIALVLSLIGVSAAQAGQRHQQPQRHGDSHAQRHHTKKKKSKRHTHRSTCKTTKTKGHKRHAHSHTKCAHPAHRPARPGAPAAPAPAPAPSAPAGAPAAPTTGGGTGTAPTTAPAPAPLLAESFTGPDGAFATSDAFWGSGDNGASENPNWFAESGTMKRRAGTGVAANGTFRMWTRRTDFQNIKVEMDLKVDALPNLRGNTASWDGVKFWLRRQLCTPEPGCGRVHDPNSQAGYTAEVGLRDGRVYIQKKVGSNYSLLSASPSNPIPYGSWMRVGGVVRNNADGSVTIQVLRNGKVLVEVTDHGTNGAPLRNAGRIGLRADNAQINVDNLAVVPAG